MNRLLELLVQFKTSIKQNRERVFHICLVASLFVHTATYAGYRISQLRGEEVVEESTFEDVDVSFEEIPPELIGGTSSPAPIEKQEWVEGSNKDKADEPDNSDINPNQLSGNGTDKDGYLFSFNGDKMVNSDNSLIRKIVINLLSNAIKFSNAGNNIYLNISYENKLEIEVLGIASLTLPLRIFIFGILNLKY